MGANSEETMWYFPGRGSCRDAVVFVSLQGWAVELNILGLYPCVALHINSSSKRTRLLTDGVFKSASSTELALVASENIGNLFLICIKTLF